MSEKINNYRRGFLSAAGMTVAAAQLGIVYSADAEFSQADLSTIKSGTKRNLYRRGLKRGPRCVECRSSQGEVA